MFWLIPSEQGNGVVVFYALLKSLLLDEIFDVIDAKKMYRSWNV